MKPKTLILMVVAVTCGLGAAYMSSRLLAERKDEDKVKILVAKKPLEMGITIKKWDDLFKIREVVKGTEPKEAIVIKDDPNDPVKDGILKPEELKGKVLKRSLRAEDHVTVNDLLSEKEVGISAMMGQGYRAIGIKVNAESIASGFASLPHSRVDIVWTRRHGTDKDTFSQTILENVLVLAADTATARSEGSSAMPASVVTVMLKPEDAQKVTLARENGSLSLALRTFDDHRKSDITKTTLEQLMTNSAGRKDIDDPSQQPPVDKSPSIPDLGPPTQLIEAPKVDGPKGKLHKIRVIQGFEEKYSEYWLNEDGQTVQSEVVRSEIPPRPPQVQPRAKD